MVIEGFQLLADVNAKILILGTMPSVKSLDKQQYYGNSQNVFWRIMEALFNEESCLEYEQKKELLMSRHIALWDVLKFCERQGSLDASIKKETMEANDFVTLFAKLPKLTHVFFNGAMAESCFKKSVFPFVQELYPTISYLKLPSTSPAYAAMRFEDKLRAWMVISECVSC
jgi:hypoxanthine-DNA glycosylase